MIKQYLITQFFGGFAKGYNEYSIKAENEEEALCLFKNKNYISVKEEFLSDEYEYDEPIIEELVNKETN